MAGDELDDAQLAHLREQVEQAGMTYAEMAGQEWAGQYARDVAHLLTEVERLRAELLAAEGSAGDGG